MAPRMSFKDFGVDAHHGFMSLEPPLRRLCGVFERWEIFLDQAFSNFVYTGPSVEITREERSYGYLWRKRLRALRVLDCRELYDDERKLQRAHHTLAFLTQFYIHSLPPRHPSRPSNDPIVIPASIAVPFVDVSRKLGIAPIVTYADTVLWNWDLIDSKLPLSRSNIKICDLFTGSKQEEHFFLTSARIEIEGWTSLNAMRLAMEASESKNPPLELISHHLRRLGKSIDQITAILLAVRDNLDPDFFYNRFRPWIQGADQGVESPPWLYEGVDGHGLILQPSGPSAGQSALMHSFDVFLDVPHPHGKRGLGGGCTRFNSALDPHNPMIECDPPTLPKDHPPVPSISFPLTPPATPSSASISLSEFPLASLPSCSAQAPHSIDTSFNARMRSYMTQPHQDFLTTMSKHSIREFVQKYRAELESIGDTSDDESTDSEEGSSSSSPTSSMTQYRRHVCTELTAAYDAAVLAMKRWRDAHIIIVTQYVIVPARRVNGANEPGNRVYVNQKTGEEVEREALPVRGTGGTSLVPLLKIYRNNTLGRTMSVAAR